MMTIKDVMNSKTTPKVKKYWQGHVGANDDFGLPITDEFYDGKTRMGPWATMSPKSWRQHGVGRTGTGYGQRYQKQDDGKWLKINTD